LEQIDQESYWKRFGENKCKNYADWVKHCIKMKIDGIRQRRCLTKMMHRLGINRKGKSGSGGATG